MMCRENKSNKSSPKEDSVMLKEVRGIEQGGKVGQGGRGRQRKEGTRGGGG